MHESTSSNIVLKALIFLGGVFEAGMGVVIILWGDLVISIATGMQTVPNYPLYWRTMGLLALALGFLQIVASRNPSKYAIIPAVACGVRFVLPILTVLQVIDTPAMAGILVLSTVFDFILAVMTIVLLHKGGYLSKAIFE